MQNTDNTSIYDNINNNEEEKHMNIISLRQDMCLSEGEQLIIGGLELSDDDYGNMVIDEKDLQRARAILAKHVEESNPEELVPAVLFHDPSPSLYNCVEDDDLEELVRLQVLIQSRQEYIDKCQNRLDLAKEDPTQRLPRKAWDAWIKAKLDAIQSKKDLIQEVKKLMAQHEKSYQKGLWGRFFGEFMTIERTLGRNSVVHTQLSNKLRKDNLTYALEVKQVLDVDTVLSFLDREENKNVYFCTGDSEEIDEQQELNQDQNRVADLLSEEHLSVLVEEEEFINGHKASFDVQDKNWGFVPRCSTPSWVEAYNAFNKGLSEIGRHEVEDSQEYFDAILQDEQFAMVG